MGFSRSQVRDNPGLGVAIGLGAACSWNLTAMGAGAQDLADGLDARLGTVGLLGAVLWLSHALSQLPGGRLIDRFGAREVALTVLCASVVFNSIACLAPNVALIGATRSLVGMCVGVGSLCAIMYVRGPTSVGKGFVGAATSLGAALPLALVPAFGPLLGWRGPFLLGAIFTVAVLIGVHLAPRDRGEEPEIDPTVGPATGFRSLITDGMLIRLAILLSAQTILSWTMGNWIVTLLADDGRFNAVVAGVLGAMVFAGGIVSRPLGAWLTSHTSFSGRRLIGTCLLSASTAVLVLAMEVPVPLIVVAVVVIGLTAGMPWAVILHAAAVARPRDAAAGVGLVGTIGTLAAVVTIPAFGAAFDSGHQRLALVLLASAGAAATLVLVVARPQEAVETVSVSSAAVLEPEGSGSRL
jgi:MFS family permease